MMKQWIHGLTRLKPLMLIALLFVGGCQGESDQRTDTSAPSKDDETMYTLVDLTPKTRSLSIVALGDHLIHGAVYKAAYDPTMDTYDFSKMYASICPLIKDYDIRYINFETLMAGEAYGYSGYPTFNGPSQGIDDLVECGFNWMSLSSNHSFDKGEQALLDEYHYFDRFDHVITTGVHDSFDDQSTYMVQTINGIDVGFLGYTYGLNGFILPQGKEYLVDLIDPARIENDLTNLSLISDIQLVSIHWGNEYATSPNEDQIRLANAMVGWGADVIIGAHPHVIQPYEWIKADNGNQGVVFYSLGNFLSAQDQPDPMLEAMACIELTMDTENSTITFDSIEAKPLINWIDHDFSDFRVIPFDEYDQDHVDSHELTLNGLDVSRQYYIALWNDIFPSHPIG